MVQTMKMALCKCLLDDGGKDWDKLLPYVNRMLKQKALEYNPFSLMFGRDPIFQIPYLLVAWCVACEVELRGSLSQLWGGE